MSAPLKIVAPSIMRQFVEPLLPEGLALSWFNDPNEAIAMVRDAEVGWLDQFSWNDSADAIFAGEKLKWVNTILAGLDMVPIDYVRQKGIIITNGRGLSSAAVADYAVMGILNLAKGFADIVRAHDRREWLTQSPGTAELEGSSALIIGYGEIGGAIGTRLKAMNVQVTGVRRLADHADSIIGADEWRARLKEFDWVVLTAPATDDTRYMIGAPELAAMKSGARLVNVARGSLIDQDALIAALVSGSLAGAFLDVTMPEPLPKDDPLWSAPNILISMHMSGRSQSGISRKGAERFVENLRRYISGQPMISVVDLSKGY